LFCRKSRFFLSSLVLALVVLALAGVSPVHAETYALSVTPGYIQEADSPGVSLVLTVNSAVNATYSFQWAVFDPSGKSTSATTLIKNTQPSFSMGVVYPRDFLPTTHVTFAGRYSVSVSQNQPTSVPNVAVGSFVVGLTDSPTYQRTFPVSILAQGYSPGEIATLNITRAGSPVVGFPRTSTADSLGRLSFQWAEIPPNLTIGNYTAKLTGTTTTKTVPDIQTFAIYPASMTIPQLIVTQNSLQKTLTEGFRFSATYPNGIQAQTGSATLRIVEADGTTLHTALASYNSTLGAFTASYRIQLSGQTGAWAATVDIRSFDDGFGNSGPIASVFRGFSVQPASLSVSISLTNRTYTVGDTVIVHASVTGPDGSPFNTGTVVALLSKEGSQIGRVPLSYIQNQAIWAGSFSVNASSPSGIWSIQVSASDPYGNAGQGSTSLLASVPPQQSFLTSNLFLILLLVLTALGTGLGLFLLLKKRGVIRRELKVDFNAVQREVAQVENREFFKSLQEQLRERKRSDNG
jgi:hypothetical protein